MKERKAIFDTLSTHQKKSVFRIAIELVKADNQIHRNEVSLLDNLQQSFCLSQEELDAIHYISLQEAVESLQSLPSISREEILAVFEEIVRVDNDVDFVENLMLSALKMVLQDGSSAWSGIISVSGIDAEVSQNQIVYLEADYCPAVHAVFDDENDFLLISKALGDIGFHLFNLANIKKNLEYDLLRHSVGYLVPSGDKGIIRNLNRVLHSLDAKSFYKIVLSRFGITPNQIASKSFLLLKLRDCFVLDDEEIPRKTVDFLYLSIESDVKKRILSFVSVFDVKVFQLPYEGYYKILLDHLSSESKIMSHIALGNNFQFFLSDICNESISFESSPQARSFYLLLLKYGQDGVEQKLFVQAIDFLQKQEALYVTENGLNLLSLEADLLRIKEDWAILIYNTIKIYSQISTKDTESKSFLRYIVNIFQYRSSLKNYINNGFMAVPHLANKEQYCVSFNPVTKAYNVLINPSMFEVVETSKRIGLTESSFWKQLY